MCEYKIIADSSCELPKNLKNDPRFERIPFRVEIDGVPVRDGKNINIARLLKAMELSKRAPKAACPSPDLFLKAIEGSLAKRIYIITISSRLNKCYDSAMMAKRIYEAENEDKEICVIDSRTASGGECLIALKITELERKYGGDFRKIWSEIEEYRDQMKTIAVVNNVEPLKKDGFFSRTGAKISASLHIKSLFGEKNGEIVQIGQCLGLQKAWQEMAACIVAGLGKKKDKKNRIVITHCNNRKGAEMIKHLIEMKTGIQDIIILSTSGMSSLFANNGGIIVAY
jgi:DegV family protein with EDD domain